LSVGGLFATVLSTAEEKVKESESDKDGDGGGDGGAGDDPR
jgi:hypothetical protein